MSDMALLRTGILVAGLILIAVIIFFGRPKKPKHCLLYTSRCV